MKYSQNMPKITRITLQLFYAKKGSKKHVMVEN